MGGEVGLEVKDGGGFSSAVDRGEGGEGADQDDEVGDRHQEGEEVHVGERVAVRPLV